jgi:hypothetical protein
MDVSSHIIAIFLIALVAFLSLADRGLDGQSAGSFPHRHKASLPHLSHIFPVKLHVDGFLAVVAD